MASKWRLLTKFCAAIKSWLFRWLKKEKALSTVDDRISFDLSYEIYDVTSHPEQVAFGALKMYRTENKPLDTQLLFRDMLD